MPSELCAKPGTKGPDSVLALFGPPAERDISGLTDSRFFRRVSYAHMLPEYVSIIKTWGNMCE